MADSKLAAKIDEWLKWDKNADTRNEISALREKKDFKTLQERLMNRITFGTAGLRGAMRAGYDSMNDLVIVQAAQGLCAYMEKQFPEGKRSFIIGYDGRHNSKRFAELTATIFVQRGFNTYLYSKMVITPFIPFGILQFKCSAGVMVTASHNPKEDNGYKVYWSNGAQIISPHDEAIHKSILDSLEPRESSWNTGILSGHKLLQDPYQKAFTAYYEELLKVLPPKFREINGKSKLRFVYTPMHGVGFPFVEEGFKQCSLAPVEVVSEQKDPDPEFPTVKFPNPEEGKSALDLSIKKANSMGINIIIANDPDADRLALAEKTGNVWKVFTGNELGALLGWWALQNHLELHPGANLSNCYMIASTVSSQILNSMAKAEGFHFDETLTGFKWMGNRAIEFMAKKKDVLFAFEESIGFMFGTTVLDKDGVSAACHLATMACFLSETTKMTLTEKLNDIYRKYGFHCCKNSYYICTKPEVIRKIFERLRNFDNGKVGTYPLSILKGQFPIKDIRDLTTGVDTAQTNKKAVLPVSASTEMITFSFVNGFIVTLRTSGTEPKIKYYAELCAKPDEKDWDALRTRLDTMLAAVIEEFLQPSVHKEDLTPKKD